MINLEVNVVGCEMCAKSEHVIGEKTLLIEVLIKA